VVVGATPPSISATALMGAVPIVLGALAMAVFGVETRRRRLEDITVEELGGEGDPDRVAPTVSAPASPSGR
ncbi:MAG: hypothetical protein KY412_00515, partial [Actinobacteria bacterium]|nr:hypothetical protein [Actinomycetota bacterium]